MEAFKRLSIILECIFLDALIPLYIINNPVNKEKKAEPTKHNEYQSKNTSAESFLSFSEILSSSVLELKLEVRS